MTTPANSITSILVLLISIFITESHSATNPNQPCMTSCGDIRNISYPFRIRGDPPSCGDPGYELLCENNKVVMEYDSGRFYVMNISYEGEILRLVDVNLYNGSCRLPSKSMFYASYDIRFRRIVFNSVVGFLKCSVEKQDPMLASIPCMNRNGSYWYVTYDSLALSEFVDDCVQIAETPVVSRKVTNPSYEIIEEMLNSGFDLGWSVECRDCFRSGKECQFWLYPEPAGYECKKPYSYRDLLIRLYSFYVGCIILITIGFARCVLAPLVIFGFLLHKYYTRKKNAGTSQKTLVNQQA